MSQEKIRKYFLLCTARMGGQRRAIVDRIAPEDLAKILTKTDIDLFLRRQNGHLTARDSVIGGAVATASGAVATAGGGSHSHPVLVIGSENVLY